MKYRKIIESAMVVAFSLVVTASSVASGDVDTKAGQYDKGSEIQNETQAATKERAAIDVVAATQEEAVVEAETVPEAGSQAVEEASGAEAQDSETASLIVPDWAADLEAEATDDVAAVSPVANLAADLEATAANGANEENQTNIGMEDNINTVISAEDGTTEELAAAEADQAGAEADAQAAASQGADAAEDRAVAASNQAVTDEVDQASDQAVTDEADQAADQASNQAAAETDQAGADTDAQADASQEADTADAAENQTVTDEADQASDQTVEDETDQESDQTASDEADQAATETDQAGADTDAQADASQEAGTADAAENQTVTDEADQASDQTVTDEADQTADQASDQTASDEEDQAVDQAAEAIDWSTKLMPDVEEYLNVRAEASEDSEVVGKMYSGSVADIKERGEDWTKISSGNVEGYVKNEFCFFDEEAKALAEENGVISAESLADDLRVRQEPSLDEDVVVMELLQKGDKVELDSETEAPEGWVAIKAFGTTGYVSSDFVTVGLNLDTAISIEEEQEAIRAAKEAAAAKAEAEASAKASAQQSSSSASSTQTTQKAAVAASYDDVTLLGALIQCEAGSEPYEGKVAVGAVVMNRLRSGFAGSISGVIYQSGQFTPASSGSLASRLANGVDSSCISAAQEAISGVDNTGGALSFRNVRSGRSGLVIGHHVFF